MDIRFERLIGIDSKVDHENISNLNNALAIFDIRDAAGFMELGYARFGVVDAALRHLVSILKERETKAKKLVERLPQLRALEQLAQPSLF